ncbi:MAG: DegV family protein [Tyzzerella sp.]|nr:DegV family protein [Tyzzerella sp.]
MIRILVDSSSDFELNELTNKNMDFVPLTITLEENHYQDGIDLNKNQLYEMLSGSDIFPKTAQPSPASFSEIFEDAKEKGDEIICILLASSLSGTCQSATIAKNMVDYDKIYIIDSLSATHAIRLMVECAVRLRDEGLSCEEIVAQVEAMKSRCKIIAGLDTLEFLCRGGRLSRTAATIGEIANLKPMITLAEDGTIKVIGKCLGRLKATSFIMKQLEEKTIDTDYSVYTLYTYGTENVEKLEAKLEKAGYKIDGRLQVGATIGAHVGPGAFGVIFVEK